MPHATPTERGMSVKPLEDSDMKIAGDSFDPAEPTGDDSDQTARELEHQKENGNQSRARRLGALMADDVSAVEGGNPAGDSVLQSQRRILLAFAVQMGLECFLPGKLLTETATAVFFDTLRETAPAFYEDLQESGAFSFYYLCVREGGDAVPKVGKTFASLCGRADNASYIRMGEELYRRFIDQVKHFVDVLGFVTEEDAS